MRIVFVRPHMFAARSADAMEPLAFGILSALTPAGIGRRLIDERVEPVPDVLDADLVAITVETYTARRAYQIAASCERRGVPVVLGGCHATFLPGEALRFARAVVTGDGESAWPRVLEDACRGRLGGIYRGENRPLDGLRVDRSIFRGKRYLPMSLVQFGRGCRYACDFCSVHALYGSSLRFRPVAEVVDELRSLRSPYVAFTDDNLFNDRDRFLELMGAIRPLRVRWTCQASLDVAADEELVRLMAGSGCTSVMIGFESLDPESLREMRKSWNRRHGTYDDVVAAFRRHGIMVYGGFVLGYDHDTLESFDEALELAVRNKLLLANFNPLTPTPGTPLYDRLARQGRLLRDPWWLHSGFRYGDGMFVPRNMSPEELHDNCYRVRTAFNRVGATLRRALDPRANARTPVNLFAFLAANLASRREIHRKQGRPLGDPSRPLEPASPSSTPLAVSC